MGGRMGSIVSFPAKRARESYGEIHVWRSCDDEWTIGHESASGGSWGAFERFPTREQAVARALELLPVYAPCKLGRIGE